MLKLNIPNETNPLEAVILGTAHSIGPNPSLQDANDPKSKQHLKAGTYPIEEDMVKEMEAVAKVFKKHGVKVYRPELIENYNQIFARDIGFVIEDRFFISDILDSRAKEQTAIRYILDQIDPSKIIKAPKGINMEGGDIMPHNEYIFVGTSREDDYPKYVSAHTHPKAADFLQECFPDKKVLSFQLRKSDDDPYINALHLDCCFQPVGKDKAIIHRNGFLEESELQQLYDIFGKDNIFEISSQEMYDMNSNIFSISEEVVISEKNFTRLNDWLRSHKLTVEEVPYAEISKQEGLLRCSTLPLRRSKTQ